MSAYYDNIEAAATLLFMAKMLAKVKLTVLEKKKIEKEVANWSSTQHG